MLHVVARLGEPRRLGLVQDTERLGAVDPLGVTGPDESIGPGAEGEADAPGGVAGRVEVLGVVPAGAEGDRGAAGRLADPRGPFVVEDLRRVRRKCGLADERAPDLRVAAEDGFRESGVSLEEILLEEPRPLGAGEIVARPHERQLEEADDRRGEGDVTLPALRQVEDEAAAGHVGEALVEAGRIEVEARSEAVDPDRLRRHLRGEIGVLGAEEDLEPAADGGGIGCPCDVPVEPLLEPVVAAIGVDEVVAHGRLSVARL